MAGKRRRKRSTMIVSGSKMTALYKGKSMKSVKMKSEPVFQSVLSQASSELIPVENGDGSLTYTNNTLGIREINIGGFQTIEEQFPAIAPKIISIRLKISVLGLLLFHLGESIISDLDGLTNFEINEKVTRTSNNYCLLPPLGSLVIFFWKIKLQR